MLFGCCQVLQCQDVVRLLQERQRFPEPFFDAGLTRRGKALLRTCLQPLQNRLGKSLTRYQLRRFLQFPKVLLCGKCFPVRVCFGLHRFPVLLPPAASLHCSLLCTDL